MSEEKPIYRVEGRTEVRRETRLPFADPNYQPPTSAEIREVLRLLGLTGSQAAALLGVESSREAGSRTIRKWTGGEREIPYSAWRLLLIDAGLALPATSTYDDERQLTWAGFKAAVAASGVRDGDVIELMNFVSKDFKVHKVEQNAGEPRYVQVLAPAKS